MSRIQPKTWALTGLAAAVGLLLVGLALWLGPATPSQGPVRPRIVDAGDLPMPQPLKPGEGGGPAKPMDQQGISLEQGAWVQVADETGRLAQQYSASRIDPERDKRLRMEQPRAVFYPRDGRVLTMRSERGNMRVPDRALESGRLEGSVVIRMYRAEGRMPDLQRDAPAMVVEADEALFDNRLGEIRCDRRVKVVTPELQFEGEGLTLLLLPDGKTIERLTVERPLSPIVVTRRPDAKGAPAAPGGVRGPMARPETEPGPEAWAPPEEPARLYRLVLERRVRIDRQSAKGRTRIEGDRLTAVFTLQGEGLGPQMASVRDSGQVFPGLGGAGLAPTLGALAMAVAPDPERTEIHYEGRLTMNLTADPADALGSRDDVRVEVDGREVRLDDEASEATIVGGLLRYETGRELLRVNGAPGQPFRLQSPRLDLQADGMEMDRRTGAGRIEGEGRMRLGKADGAAVEAVARAPAAAASGEPVQAAETIPGSERTVHMTWRDGVALAFEPGAEQSRLRQADFRGAVVADAGEVRLDAGRLVVECRPQGARDAVTRILAEGDARAVRVPEGSSLAGQRVELQLEPQPDGGSRPLQLLADGNVEALQREQRLWAEAMECTFVPAGSGERADLDQVRTRGAVQALVSRDVRIWAASMDADPSKKSVTLRGPDLLLVRGNAVADGMSEVQMDETSGHGMAPGPGRCRYYLSSLADDAPRRLDRPAAAGTPQMETTWRDGLTYRRIDPSASVLQLSGGVQAMASREARERDDLQAQEVLLWMVRADGVDAGGDASSLRRVRATGGVRLESRQWGCDDRSDEPRLLRLVAEDVTHDVATGEADVPTPGTLLVFDRDDEGVKSGPPSLFDGRGTTRFRWGQALAIRRVDGEAIYRITMADQAELVHAGLRERDTLTITSDAMEAIVERRDGGPAAATKELAQPADLGGAVKLQRVVADGRVLVRSPETDVECDRFDYDLRTRIASLAARPGRVITVLQKGPGAQPIPLRAESAIWDMENGSIRVIGAVGTGMR
jgi:lipopolysaccharide export system protein LptA